MKTVEAINSLPLKFPKLPTIGCMKAAGVTPIQKSADPDGQLRKTVDAIDAKYGNLIK